MWRNLPTGVLYDLWGEEGEDLPWPITVHFTNFPAKMLRCTNEETVRAHYMSNLKEANYLKHGDGAKVNTLSVESQTDLWDGLRLEKYDQFWKVHRQLEATVQKIKSVPVRFVRRNLPFVQLPLAALTDQGTPWMAAQQLACLPFFPALHTHALSLSLSLSAYVSPPLRHCPSLFRTRCAHALCTKHT